MSKMLRRRQCGLRGIAPYVEWPPAPRKRKALETVTCPHCEREFTLEPYRPGIRHAGEVCDKVRQETAGGLQESFWVLYLNNRNRVAGKTRICHGTANACVVHPRDVFREAVARNAAAVIVAHNHPSGNALPSPEDISLTERLLEAGKVVGIGEEAHDVRSRAWSSGRSINHGADGCGCCSQAAREPPGSLGPCSWLVHGRAGGATPQRPVRRRGGPPSRSRSADAARGALARLRHPGRPDPRRDEPAEPAQDACAGQLAAHPLRPPGRLGDLR